MKRNGPKLRALLSGALLVRASLPLSAREGYVETYTGPIYEGHIRVQSNTVIVVNSALALRVELPTTNVAGLTFLGPVTGGIELLPLADPGAALEWPGRDEVSGRWPPSPPRQRFTPVVQLRSASSVKGRIHQLDASGLSFLERPERAPLSRAALANIRFQPLPQWAGTILSSGRTGALLATGEFIDGECRAIVAGELILHSVPLGVCRFSLRHDVIVAVFAPRRDFPSQPCVIETSNGTTWLATDLWFEPGLLVFREPLLGRRRLPLADITEFHRQPPSFPVLAPSLRRP